MKSSQWLYWGIVAMITISHVLIYLFMPYSCDDYWYMTSLRDYCMGIDTSFPAEGLWACWCDHFRTDNIRLANIIFTFFLLIPKMIPSVISGLFVGVMLWLAAKVSGINSRNPLLMAVMALMLSFLLPWYEQMFTLCFAFNYIWASVLMLMLAYIFFCKETLPAVAWSFILGLIAGAWHEGFSVPLLCGFTVYAILCRRIINRRHIAMMLGLVVGILWLANAPGLQMNVGYKTTSLELAVILHKLVLYHVPLLLLIGTVIIALITRNTRKLIIDPQFVALASICMVGVMLNLMINVGVRTGWVGYLFGIIATIYLWKKMKTAKYGQTKAVVKHILAIAVSSFLLVHYVVVTYYAIKINSEFENVLEKYHGSPDGVVFADVTYDYQALPLAWKKPYFESFTYDWVTYWVDKYYYDCRKQLKVIPTCLFDAENLDAIKVKGDNPFMMYGGFLYAPIGIDEPVDKVDFYEIDFGHSKKKLFCSNFIFATKSGNRYYFSFPQRATVHRWIGDIEAINKVK